MTDAQNQNKETENGTEDDLPEAAEQETDEPAAEDGEDAQGPSILDLGPNPDLQNNRVKELEDQLARAKDQMMRALADAENTRKRAIRDKEDIAKYAISGFAKDLLDFADNFGRALQSLPTELKEEDERIGSIIDGIETMEKELFRVFDKHGIEKLEPQDELFNPNFHEVMFEVPGTGKPAGTVIQIIEPGYTLRDRLIRPARVGVAKDDGGALPPTGMPGKTFDEEV